MMAVDLHSGIRRAIKGLQPQHVPQIRCKRAPIARRHASLPIRSFSSVPSRRASVEPPKHESESAVSGANPDDLGFEGSGETEAVPEFTAAPEIDLDADGSDVGPESLMKLPNSGLAKILLGKHKNNDRKGSSRSSSDEEAQMAAERAEEALLKRLRVVPASPSYFTSRPIFTDHYLEVSALYRSYKLLPTTPSASSRITWVSLNDYKMAIGRESVQSGRFRNLIAMCARLTRINPHLMPPHVRPVIERFIAREEPLREVRRPRVLDRFGRAYGLGKRKSAIARAWIVKGEGQILVNGKSLSEYFARIHQRESAIYGLKVTERVGDYNVFVVVQGGGNTGQAEAITLAVSRALLVYEPHLLAKLRTSGCLRRDPRRVERKKPGKLKARKMPAWVKR